MSATCHMSVPIRAVILWMITYEMIHTAGDKDRQLTFFLPPLGIRYFDISTPPPGWIPYMALWLLLLEM